MAQPARVTGELLARKDQALPTVGFTHPRLDLVAPQPSAAPLEQQRCGTSVAREALLPRPQVSRDGAPAEPAPRARP